MEWRLVFAFIMLLILTACVIILALAVVPKTRTDEQQAPAKKPILPGQTLRPSSISFTLDPYPLMPSYSRNSFDNSAEPKVRWMDASGNWYTEN